MLDSMILQVSNLKASVEAKSICKDKVYLIRYYLRFVKESTMAILKL